MPLGVRRAIYDTWVENSISSTDCCNGWNVINISKVKYFSLYRYIENKKIVVEKKKNKRRPVQFQANRMILICTVSNIHNKLTESGARVSLDKVMNLKPFFITYPTEEEISLCLRKLCLNV